jgi:general secretion pathway protein G
MTPRRRRGFTLIEVMVVVVILGLLAGLIVPQIFGRVGEARVTAARTQMELFAVALDGYRLDTGRYPTSSQGLAALWTAPTAPPIPTTWRGPYLRKPVPNDPWGHPFQYVGPAAGSEQFTLRSLGRDGAIGGRGDDADLDFAASATIRK